MYISYKMTFDLILFSYCHRGTRNNKALQRKLFYKYVFDYVEERSHYSDIIIFQAMVLLLTIKKCSKRALFHVGF